MTEQFNFVKDFHDQTTLHPMGLMFLALSVFGVMIVARQHVLTIVLMVACFIAPAQRFVIVDLDFTFLRAITAVALLRILVRGDHHGLKLNLLDRTLLIWAGYSVLVYLALYPSMVSLINQLGMAFDAIATYVMVRMLVRDVASFTALARGIAVLSIPVAAAMTYERLSGINLFSFLGGVPEQSLERYGRFRAQGAFSHPIIAGTFWAAMIPLILAGIRRDLLSIIMTTAGVIGSLVIIWCSSSSTPVLLVGGVAIGVGMYFFRWAMPSLRMAVVLAGILLHVAMIAPVWHLFARINFFKGSTGWWRYLIIDRFIGAWDEWALMGTTRSQSWLPGNTFVDVTNHYVTEGVSGGIVKLSLFIALIVIGFVFISRATRRLDEFAGGHHRLAVNVRKTWVAWCVGICLSVHVMAYFATAYFGQAVMLQFLTFALAASVPTVLGRPTIRVVGHAGAESEAAVGDVTAGHDRPPWVPGTGLATARNASSLFRPV
jgi:hypothetical protein